MTKYSNKPRASLKKQTSTPFRPFVPAPAGKKTTYTDISDTIACVQLTERIKSYPDSKGGFYTKPSSF